MELQYSNKWHKSLTTKGLAQSEGLSVREAECHLDAYLFLDEYTQWKAGGPHHTFILQRMFLHAAELGQKKWNGLFTETAGKEPWADARVDVPAIQLMGYKTSWGEI